MIKSTIFSVIELNLYIILQNKYSQYDYFCLILYPN